MDKRADRRIVCAALLVIVCAAAVVVGLQMANAKAPRGILENAVPETDENLLPVVEEVQAENGLLRVKGMLLRPGQDVGAVNVRFGILKDGKVRLLNTEMVRRPEEAAAHQSDDHCGAQALADLKDIPDGEYELVFVDQRQEEVKVIPTNVRIALSEGAMRKEERP